MNIREMLMRDFGIDVRISAGIGFRDNPYVVERCSAEEAALTQVNLLRGIGRGRNELWRIIEWRPCNIGSATEVIRIEALWFTPEEVITEIRNIYFNTRLVSGEPNSLHPLASWRGPLGTPVLPYELGWLHFVRVEDNSHSHGRFDQTIFYGGAGAKGTVYVYARPSEGERTSRDVELECVAALVLKSYPELQDPWQRFEVGPFAIKVFLSATDLTTVGVAESGPYFVKVRLTHFDDLKMRELMKTTLQALAACVESTSATQQ